MRVGSLVFDVRREVEKPFSEKLERSRQLLRLWGKLPNSCVACSFGKDSVVVLSLALEVNPEIKVIFGDTGVEFPETIRLARELEKSWRLNLSVVKPETTFWKVQDRIKREHLRMDDGRKHSNICCYALKEKPFRLWAKREQVTRSITGITASESRHRMFVACQKGQEYYSKQDGFWKVHPIMFWTEEEVWSFIENEGLPKNLAYEKYGINRIGCMWCMSHKGWREQIARINPKVYAYMVNRYFPQKVLM